MSVLIRNGRIVTACDDYVADIYVENEQISQIGRGLSVKADTILDASERLVLPGGVDPHTHLDMPCGDISTTDDFETGTRAAALGGTTTLIDFANQTKGRSLIEAFETWLEKASGKASIDYGLHVTITDLPDERLSEMRRLVDEGVTSFKLFMAYPGRLYVDDGILYRAMVQASGLGAIVMMHAENGIVIDEIVAKTRAMGHMEPRYHASTRPVRMEAEAVHRAFAIGEVADCPVYIVHVSSADALEQVTLAQSRGLAAYSETCPQYLFLDETAYDREGLESAKYVMTPALRERHHQAALWQGLRMGRIQTVATDHCPFSFARHKAPVGTDFTRIPNGAPGIENRMTLMFHGGVVQGRIGLNRFVQVTSTNAAKLFGVFPRKGTIAVGSDGDLVIFDPNRELTIGVNNRLTHHMNVDYNAYEGMRVKGFVETVVMRGRVICHRGEFLGNAGSGRYLKRECHSKCGAWIQ